MYVLDRYSPEGFRLTALTKGEGTGEELNLGNCVWFMTASFLQQGPDYTPRGTAEGFCHIHETICVNGNPIMNRQD